MPVDEKGAREKFATKNEAGMTMGRQLISVFDHIVSAMHIIAGVLLVLITLGVSVGVASRYFFNRPIGWIVEISSYGLLYITFLVAAWVLKEDGHVSMDFIVERFNPKARAVINMLTSATSAVVCLVLTWFGLAVTWNLFKTKHFTSTMLELPKSIIIVVIALGSLMLFIQLIRRTHCSFRTWQSLKF